MSERTEQTPVPEQPDVNAAQCEDTPECLPNSAVCESCLSVSDDGEACCAQTCGDDSPISAGAVIGAVLAVAVMLFSVFLLGVNLLIARQVSLGDKALQNGDLRSCYTYYANSYDVAQRLNNLLVPNASKPIFTNGSATVEKQIQALYRLNGPYQAGQAIDSVFAGNVPASLKSIYAEYTRISDFVERMQQSVSQYKNTLREDETGNYDDMIALVDNALKQLPETPEYMAQYYRFSVSYSLADDPERTCSLLDTLIKMSPNSLWLYASEGIRAYNLAGRYEDALTICNRLMKLDASAPSTIAYTMAQLRLLQKYDNAIQVYERGLALTTASSEMERQRAIILMLQGDSEQAQQILIDSYNPATATLEHLATLAVCAHINGNKDVYDEYKSMLDSYVPFAQVDAFVAGEVSLEDIFLTHGGEIQ